MDCLDGFETYDLLFEAPLAKLGWQTDTISWRAKNVNWNEFQAVIIRTPWDYQEDAPAFLQVLERIEKSSAHLENSFEIVRWNIDKIYLQDLAKLDVNLVPTIWQERLGHTTLSSENLSHYFEEFNSNQYIIKPRISANADNTFWLTKKNLLDNLAQVNEAFEQRDFMIQPFITSILDEGEYSLFYFNGQYSHAILKTPKDSDFRVQEEHGGRLKTIEPEKELLSQAQKCMEAISQLHQMPLYARVDLVRYQQSFVLMEAELIEPSLYFNMDADSPQRFAEAFVERMNKLAL